MKVKPMEDTFSTLSPVNRVLRLFVLSTVKKQKNILVQCWSLPELLIILTLLTVISISFLIQKILRFEAYINQETLKFTDSLQLTYLLGFAQYILDLIYVFKYRNTRLKYLQLYNSIDKLLGTPDFTTIRSKIILATVALIVTFSFTSTIDFLSWFLSYGWVEPILYSVEYLFNFINALTILDLVSHVIQIEYRLRRMTSQVEDCYSFHLPIREELMEGLWVVKEGLHEDVQINRVENCDKYFDIKLLSKCYVLLMEQVTNINSVYGIRVGAYCALLLINLIYQINTIIRVTLGLFVPPNPSYHLPTISTVVRVLNYSMVIHVLVHRCRETYAQHSNLIRIIDLIIVTKTIPNDLKVTLTDLRSLMLSRPVEFHGAYYFTLDYPLLVSITSVVVTYTIILLQSMN